MKTTVTLQAPATTYDEARIATQAWNDVATLRGVFIPVKSEVTQSDDGLNTKLFAQFFTKQSHAELKSGNRIIANGQAYYIFGDPLDFKKIRQVELRDEI